MVFIMRKYLLAGLGAVLAPAASFAQDQGGSYTVPASVDTAMTNLTNGASAWIDKIIPFAAGIMVLGLGIVGIYLVWRVFRRVFG